MYFIRLGHGTFLDILILTDAHCGGVGMSGQRRKLRNILVNRNFQLKHWFYIFFLGLTVMGSMVLSGLWSFLQFLKSPLFVSNSGMSEELHGAVIGMVNEIVMITVGLVGFYAISSLWLSVFMSHRVFGPLVPIKRYIGELRNGNFDAELRLRRKDELKDLADELRLLAESMKKNR
jgi:HAMP domain-containing protein